MPCRSTRPCTDRLSPLRSSRSIGFASKRPRRLPRLDRDALSACWFSAGFHRGAVGSGAVSVKSETPVVQTRGLVKRYGDLAAVDGVDLMVPAGDVYGLLGPNGAGKTTFMRMLFGLIRPDEG